MSATEVDAADVDDGVQLQLHPGEGEHQALVAAIDAWAMSLASPHTRRAYRRAIERLIDRYGEVSAVSLAEFRDDLADEGARAGTVRQAMTGVVSCTRWLVDAGFVPGDVLRALERVDRPRSRDDRPPKAPTPAQVLALRQIAPATAFPGDPLRQAHGAAIVALLADTGLRVSEAVALKRAQIRPARPRAQLLAAAHGRATVARAASIDVLEGKGGVARTVPVGADVLRALEHLDKIADLPDRAGDPAIPALAAGGRRGRVASPDAPMSTRTVGRILQALGDAIALPPGTIYPHALRHAYALGQLDPTQRPDGKPLTLGTLQRRLGHRSSATTARYLLAAEDPDLAML
ncbi:unannotated protein [freshwater metagenome]|uniref:Unannotated protein n=1 Tax=freshwater metagenome TaxID=449393 RepID=A0A6J7FAP0_9ZZZZ|nr:tyrosine-type recombinase/integrase [Actinomycetota bacterium]